MTSPLIRVARRADRMTRRSRRHAFNPGPEALEGRALMAYSALDPTFGIGGIERNVPGSTDPVDVDQAVTVLADGKIVELATSGAGSAFVVRRLNVDGSLDASFGTNGEVAVPLPPKGNDTRQEFEVPHRVSIGPDGSINFAAAIQYNGSDSYSDGLPVSAVFRVTADGQLDPGFGTNGAALIATPGIIATHVAVQNDGSVLVAGSDYYGGQGLFVARFTPAGTTDPTFNGTGQLQIPAAQTGGYQLSEPAGIQVDSTFGVAGTSIVAQSLQQYKATDMALNSLGRIVLVGYYGPYEAEPTASFLFRRLADGTADTSFGVDGAATSLLNGIGLESVAIGANDSITVGGTAYSGGELPSGIGNPFGMLGVARYAADGTPNLGFGTRGRYTVPLGTRTAATSNFWVLYAGLAATPSGGIVVLGSTPNTLAKLLPVAVSAPNNDYDGDGKGDVAAFLTDSALYAYRPSSGSADVLNVFGQPGAGNSIPAPGDYDGSGYTELAAYFPSLGALYYRPAAGGPDVKIEFGSIGAGNSIPAPGDYDGDGRTDVAVYIPSLALYAYRPSSGAAGGPDVVQSFGVVGDGATIPAPGDYDGDGRTDIAAYVPKYALYAYRPSSAAAGGPDSWTSFGAVGDGATIPVASIPYARPPLVSGRALASPAGSAGVPMALTDDLLAELAGLAGNKKKHA